MSGWLEAGRGLVTDVLGETRRVELLDRSYTIAASAFVALLPLILVTSGIFTADPSDPLVANQLIDRLDLEGTAATAVRLLVTGATPGLYPLGLAIVLYSAFSLSRRVGRAYSMIWQVPPLPLGQQWRGLVWVLLQVALIWSITGLRELAGARGPVLWLIGVAGAMVVWFAAEAASQHLLTLGAVPWARLRVAAALVAVGRLGMTVWASVYLSGSLSRQAAQYGPIGVVFALFTALFVAALVILGGTLLAAVLTAPKTPVAADASDAAGDPDAAGNGASADSAQ